MSDLQSLAWKAKIGTRRPEGFLTVREWGEHFGAYDGGRPWRHQRTKAFLDSNPDLFERGSYRAPGSDGRMMTQVCYRERQAK